MSKEQLLNLKELSEEELRSLLKEAESSRDYALQVQICRALLPFEERPCLALTAIKELEVILNRN